MSPQHTCLAVSRVALEAFERQSGLPDVAKFLVETGRVKLNNEMPEQPAVLGVEYYGRENPASAL